MSNLSPLDGRYAALLEPLKPYLSEESLYRYRARIELEWLIHQAEHPQLRHVQPIRRSDEEKIRAIESSLDFERLYNIENEVLHDVKAIEIYVGERLEQIGLHALKPAVHFGCTSEDVVSVAYSLMLKDAFAQVLEPEIRGLVDDLRALADKHRDLVILGFTHGQPAVPTTLGKEFAVYAARLDRQLEVLSGIELFAKFSGAVGSYNAHVLAYPEVDWQKTCRHFVESFGLRHSPLTTQVDSRDSIAELLHLAARMCFILIDLAQDIWMYGLVGYLRFSRTTGMIGSSTMPQKANPIRFENAEANAKVGSGLLLHLSEALTISRLQRDLADSSTARNFGAALAHFFIALVNCRRGMAELFTDDQEIERQLADRWDIMSEAAQTLLRKAGVERAFDLVQEVERGKGLTKESLLQVLGSALPEDRERFASLQPSDYHGLSSKLVDHVIGDSDS